MLSAMKPGPGHVGIWAPGWKVHNTHRIHSSIEFQTPSAWEYNVAAVAKTA